MSIAHLLLTFGVGAAYELGCTFWVHFAERDRRPPAVGFSMFNALVTAVGVEHFLLGWPFLVAYILGFGTGTYLGMLCKYRMQNGRWRREAPHEHAVWHEVEGWVWK